jgi:hypothetical protein
VGSGESPDTVGASFMENFAGNAVTERSSQLGQSLPNCNVRVASVHPSISDMMLQRRERRNWAMNGHRPDDGSDFE